ncbi:glycosyltransferase [Rhodococcus sp. MEB064]|uniref:glycosyltransferase n=1 Tax=Rhodococcus sp. MEB064 TaxID=1587522 RepID=UPI0009E30121|nr:glycosyltransferase [Rhodococcus sp. MEB064]
MIGRTVCIIGTRGYPSYYGGFETLLRHLAPFLVERGWNVVVYGRPGATVDRPEGMDDGVISVETRGIESRSLSTLTYGMTSTVHAVMMTPKPDVALVLNVANGFWLPMLRARNIPSLVNVDGIEWEREKWGRAARSVFRVGGSLTARYADDLVYDSTSLGDRWYEKFGREGVFIPYGGVFRDYGPTRDGLTRRGYVLMVARFVPENSIDQFLDAARILGSRWPIVIVGSSGYGGEIEDRVTALTTECTNVRWYGHVSDDDALFALWENAGAYFHGHSVGGTNPALVQAMACGAPTVARDTAYNREVLGPHAEYVTPDPDAIVRGIDALMSSSARQEQLSAGVSRRAREKYTWDDVCTSYDMALTRLATQPSPSRVAASRTRAGAVAMFRGASR